LTSHPSAARTTENEIAFERVFDAPREVIFRAWTDPEGISNWWGPRGFTTTTHEMDVRPGGVWRFTMHGPDGTDYQNRVVYTEVVPPEHLVYEHGAGEDSDFTPFHVTVTFAEEGTKTRLALRMRFASAEQLKNAIDYGARDGGLQTLDRLAEYLAKPTP
jgi:uncharacterized protein YndB with AHSA1/START domain